MGLKDLLGLGGAKKDQPIRERTPLTLLPGDMVEYEGQTYFITVKYTLDEGGWIWYEYRLDDGEGNELWLTAEEEDGALETTIYWPVKAPELEPGAKRLTFEGREYQLDESGTATASMETKEGHRSGLKCRYWDYVTKDENELLSLEQWNGGTEVSRGKAVNEFDYELYPGS